MSAMLLSIKPKYAKVILEGKKQYEFRKSRPKDGVDRIIFYASAPQKEVVGEALIDVNVFHDLSLSGLPSSAPGGHSSADAPQGVSAICESL